MVLDLLEVGVAPAIFPCICIPPKYCGAAPARGQNTLEARGLEERPQLYAVYSVTVQSVVCKGIMQCPVSLVQCNFALFSFQYSLQFDYVVCNVQYSG